MDETTSEKPARSGNPLWVISLLVGISEVALGLIATQTTGWTQVLIAIFAVVFPVGVAGAFFFILWHRPYLFYAPFDYPESTPVLSFVHAMRTSSLSNSELVDAIKMELSQSLGLKSRIQYSELTAAVDEAIGKARDRVMEKPSVSILLKPIDQRQGWVDIPLNAESSVSDLLDRIWYLISDSVPAYSYNRFWVLTDIEYDKGDDFSGRLIKSSGKNDKRQLSSVGIAPGMKLAVMRPWEQERGILLPDP